MDVSEIQAAIQKLPNDKQAELAAWFADQEQAEWDAEIERDFSPGGPGIELIETFKQAARSGGFRPFEQSRPEKP